MELLTKASWSDEVTQREKDNLQVAYLAACESIVMLKNDGALPFESKKVALYGPGVSMTIKGGTGSGEVNERHSVTILEGMENRGFEVTTRDWISRFEANYQEKLAENGVMISFSNAFEEYMSTKGYEPAYGARPIKRLMQKELINLLAKSILDGKVRRDSNILIDINDGQISITEADR